MRIASREEMRTIDTETSRLRGVSAELLMEVAGARAVSEIENLLSSGRLHGAGSKKCAFIVVCGVGHNGADGLVVARHLKANGHAVVVHLIGDQSRWSELYRRQLERVRDFEVEVRNGFEGETGHYRSGPVVIVDAVFGIGLDRETTGAELAAIKAIRGFKATTTQTTNEATNAKVISLDVPSGLDVDRGVALGVAVVADFTLAFGLAKCGFFIHEGPQHVGRVIVVPIGFPRDLVQRIARKHSLFDRASARKLLPKFDPKTNKARRGRALLVAGSRGMWGAAILSATSAARSGAGYVVLASSDDAKDVLLKIPEVLHAQASEELWNDPKWTALAIGPGMGLSRESRETVERVMRIRNRAVVADADAITILSEMKNISLGTNWVLTPHAGELSRLLGVDAREIESDRMGYALMAAKKFNAVVLLKGFRTVIAHPGSAAEVSGKVVVISSGNSALAKAGSGDVLTGVILGFLAQGLDVMKAASLGAYVHGLAADLWVASGKGRASLLPTDVRDAIPKILGDLAHARSAKVGDL